MQSKRVAGTLDSMAEACVAITRGGVTYRIPVSNDAAPALPLVEARAQRPSTAAAQTLARLRKTLDLTDQDDLRAGAILAVLCAGVRKNELVALDVGDVGESEGSLALRIRRSRPNSRTKDRVVLLSPESASLLRRYWARERLGQQATDAPLFWTLGRHGRCTKQRITGHAVNYWLEQLRRRGGLEKRLTPRALRGPLLEAPLAFAHAR